MNKKDQGPKKAGRLFGIGVGPGDPELIPLKSIRIISSVDTVFSASSSKNDHSLAVKIARPHIPLHIPIKQLPFPMTMDKEIVQRAWKEHSQTIIQELEKGRSAAFLTLGDPLTYSTFGYLLRIIQKQAPHIEVETIPGITSYQAAAATTNTPLVEGEENLLVLSGVMGGMRFRKMACDVDNVVFLKAYKNLRDITSALDESGRLDDSLGIIRCGMPQQEIIKDMKRLHEKKPNYWTLVISKHRNNEK